MIDDTSLAHGFLKGEVPFEGSFHEGGAAREISGGLVWRAVIPDPKPEEGMLDVCMSLFVDEDSGLEDAGFSGMRGRKMRLKSGMVSRLNEGDSEAGDDLLGMLLAKSGNAGRFDIHQVRRE